VTGLADSNPRKRRFTDLLSEIEASARKILDGRERDIPYALTSMVLAVQEARDIAYGVSREALDKVVK
jgi:hypothetical protein